MLPAGNRRISRGITGLILLGFAILYAALYLRGLDFGRPICEHPDEWAITEQAMNMAVTGPLHPLREYTYGSLSIFIQCGVCSLLHAYNNAFGIYRDAENRPVTKDMESILKNRVDSELFRFYLAARIGTACYAAGLFWILYLLGMRLFASRLLAGLCVAAAMLNPLMMQQAHFALPNVPATCLALASVYCAIIFLDGGGKRTLYAGAILAGLAIGTKITVIWAFAVIAAATLFRLRAGGFKHILILSLVFCAAVLAAEPYLVLDTRHFISNFAREAHFYSHGAIIDSTILQREAFGTDPWRWLGTRCPLFNPLLYGFHQGAAYFVACLAGLLFLPFGTGRKGLAAILFPAVFFVFIGMQRKVLTTNYVPLIPFGALGFGALGFGLLSGKGLYRWIPRPAATAGVVAAALLALAVPARSSLGIARQFTTQDPYQTALAWKEANIPKSAAVFMERQRSVCFPFVIDPYTVFLNSDYVIALSPGMCDRFPWFQSVFVAPQGTPLQLERYRRTRDLNERRLVLLRRVTPEECGYVPYAEMPVVAHDVCIYKVPKVTPIRMAPPKSVDNGKPRWEIGAGSATVAHVALAAGRYDVFLEAAKKIDATDSASLEVRVDAQPGVRVDFLDTDHVAHFVSTIEVDMPRDVRFTIEIEPIPASAPPTIWVYGLVCVPTTGEMIPGIPVAAARDRSPAP